MDNQKEQLSKLIDRYESLTDAERKKYNEANTRRNFILPLFEILGWDIRSEDVSEEVQASGKRVDYAFKINDITRFFIEAKSLVADLDEIRWSEQAIWYAYHKSVPWVVLTNFEKIKVFNAEWDSPEPETSLFFELKYTDYLENFEKLLLLSRKSVESGELDKKALEWGKKPKTVSTVGERLTEDLLNWRNNLFNDLVGYNPDIKKEVAADSVQKFINRLIFIRTCEDRGLEQKRLQEILRAWEDGGKKNNDLIKRIQALFSEFNDNYDSKLFEYKIIFDADSDKLIFEESVIAKIIKETYKNSRGIRWNFNDINADVLGSVYEQYLGQIQSGKANKEENKSSKRKSQGIYYTPRYIVDYIVKNTLGEALKDKNFNEILKLKILDPACGSGSFLIRAFEEALSHLRKETGKINRDFDDYALRWSVLTSMIYGVDLDQEAVEITQLNLLLKTLGKREKLPNLSNKIDCGNSLISGSETELKKYFGKNWKDKKPFNWEERFPEVFKQGGFDVIIGNPPYVRVDSLDDEEKGYWKDIFNASEGKYDLYYLFIEETVKLLKPGGYLGLIVPNKFCVASSAKKLRELIKYSSEQCKFVSVSRLDVFADASNYPVILLLKKGKEAREIRVESFNSVADFLKNNHESYSLNKENKIILPAGIIPININQSQLELALKLIKNNKKLSNFLKVSEGLRIPPKFETETKEKFGIVKQYQFERYSPIKSGAFISESNINKFVGKNSARFINSFKEKIVIAEDALNIISTIDADFHIPQGGVYFGVLSNEKLHLKYVMSLLNSHLLSFLYKVLFGGMHMGGGYLRYRTEFLEQLPLVEATSAKQKEFIKLADKMLELNKKLQKIDPILDEEEYKELKTEIDKTDKEIDEKVYKLYDLTPEEIMIVENDKKTEQKKQK